MARREFLGNVVETATTGALSSADTSISLTDGSTFPTGSVAPFVIVLDRGTSLEEKVLVTSRSSNTLTVSQRGYDGTTAVSHSSGAFVDHVLDATTIDEVNSYVNLQSAKGDLVVHNGTNPVVKTVGTDGYVLSANSAQADGLEWIQVGVQAGSVGTTELAADAVTNAKIADDAVDTEHIADYSLGRRAMFPVATYSYSGGTVTYNEYVEYPTLTETSDPDGIALIDTDSNGINRLRLGINSLYAIHVTRSTITSQDSYTATASTANLMNVSNAIFANSSGNPGFNFAGVFVLLTTGDNPAAVRLAIFNNGYNYYDINYTGGTITLYKLFG